MKNFKVSSLVLVLGVLIVAPWVQGVAQDAPSAPPVVAPAQPAPSAASASVSGGSSAVAPGVASAQPAPSLWSMAMPFLVMMAVMYFLMIRPQQKKMKEHQALIQGLKAGDEVVTQSGILGSIAGLNDKVVTLEVARGVQIKVLKAQVQQVVKGSI